jgi:hypothetical protein
MYVVIGLIALVLVGVVAYFMFFNKKQYRIRIERPLSLGIANDIHHLHIGEIEIFKKDGTLAKLICNEPCTNPMGPQNNESGPQKAIDGNNKTIYHNKYTGQYNPENPFYGTEDHFLDYIITDVSSIKDIKSIKITVTHPQTRRLQGVIVSILENNNPIWNNTIKTPSNAVVFNL